MLQNCSYISVLEEALKCMSALCSLKAAGAEQAERRTGGTVPIPDTRSHTQAPQNKVTINQFLVLNLNTLAG